MSAAPLQEGGARRHNTEGAPHQRKGKQHHPEKGGESSTTRERRQNKELVRCLPSHIFGGAPLVPPSLGWLEWCWVFSPPSLFWVSEVAHFALLLHLENSLFIKFFLLHLQTAIFKAHFSPLVNHGTAHFQRSVLKYTQNTRTHTKLGKTHNTHNKQTNKQTHKDTHTQPTKNNCRAARNPF